MKKITNFINKYYLLLLFLIFSFAILIRLFNLGNNPIAISHDELDYVLSGKAIALSGTDLTGEWNPLSLTPIQTETSTSELFPVLEVLPNLFLPLNLFSARILSVVLSSATALVLGLLINKLTKNKSLSLLTTLIFSLNPWSILFSHTAYEAPNSLFFYISGIYFLLLISNQKSFLKSIISVILSVVFFSIGFYSYHGYKLIFPLLVAVPFIWQWFTTSNKKQLVKPYLLFIFLMILVVAKFIISMSSYSGRQSELLFLNTDLLAKLVNEVRKLGFSSPYSNLFINKYTFLFREMMIRYLNSFNPINLFITGSDQTVLFSLMQTGYLYLIELPLIFTGGYFLFKRYKNVFVLLLLLLLTGPLPAASHVGSSTALRAGFIFPILSVFSAAGLYLTLKQNIKSHFWKVVKLLVVFFLTLNISYFWYTFQNNYPVYSADNYFFQERLLSNYTHRVSDKEVYVLTSNPYSAFRAYLFYQNQLNIDTFKNLSNEFQKGTDSNYQFKSINWTSTCSVLEKEGDHVLIVEEVLLSQCKNNISDAKWENELYNRWEKFPTFIASPIDSRSYYAVINSDLCTSYSIPSYVYNNDQRIFLLDSLDHKLFCEKWILSNNALNNKLKNLQ